MNDHLNGKRSSAQEYDGIDLLRPDDGSLLRDALRFQEERLSGEVPDFARIVARIEAEPSPLAEPRWPAAKSLRIAGSLALAQLRAMPRAVLPAALAVIVASVAAACVVASVRSADDAVWWLSAILLIGAALTATMAAGASDSDALALSTPLGPQVVVLSRLAMVLILDALAGLSASAVVIATGFPLDFAALASSWLVPLAVVAGASSFVSVWLGTSWAGAVTGVVLVPLVLPSAQATTDMATFALAGALHSAFDPAGLIVGGVVLLAASVCLARRSALARVRVP